MHADELTVSIDTVRVLIARDFPAWMDLPIRPVRSVGTVNAIFRLGDELAARFPLRNMNPADAREWLNAESSAAAELAMISPVPTPVTMAIGEPGAGYPLPWMVQTWLSGHDATVEDPANSDPFAVDLAAFIAALRDADTAGRHFRGSGRGGHLPAHDEWVEACLRKSEDLLDTARLRAMWEELRALPEIDDDAMCHGDLTPPNVLVQNGRLVGVIDVGGFGPADPALDLVAAWHLLDDRGRDVLRRALDCGEVQWRRGMAWAFEQALGLVWYYQESNPVMSAWGRRTLDRLVSHS